MHSKHALCNSFDVKSIIRTGRYVGKETYMDVFVSIAVRSVSPVYGQHKAVLAALAVSVGVVACIAYIFHKLVLIYAHHYNIGPYSVISMQMYCRQLSVPSSNCRTVSRKLSRVAIVITYRLHMDTVQLQSRRVKHYPDLNN